MNKPNSTSRRSLPRKPAPAEPENSLHTSKASGSSCVVCGGNIIQESSLLETASTIKMQHIALYCEGCGIMYKFAPKKKL